ncbi:hypothetical protein GQ53DRAFT_762584 [Thozetella sp. PMI_491]|nr:hypothetical protein GQ53DRAFT_762584 [Thozetella sp. PMI_491]
MYLLALPSELIQQIFTFIILSRELARVMRLRLVCRGFKLHIDDAIFRLRYLDQFRGRPRFIESSVPGLGRHRQEWGAYIYSYLAYKAPNEHSTKSYLGRVYHSAQTLCRWENNPGRESLSSCLRSLLQLAAEENSRLLFQKLPAQRECSDIDLKADVFAAAVYLGRRTFVGEQLAQGYQLSKTDGQRSYIFGDPFKAATLQGDLAMIKLLLSYSSQYSGTGTVSTRVQETLISVAAKAGHRAAFDFALDGGCLLDVRRADFRHPGSAARSTLVGILHCTPYPDQFERVARLLGFENATPYPAQLDYANSKLSTENRTLNLSGPEVLAYWLSESVSSKNVGMMTMRILLEAGADPNCATAVELLLDHGADVNKGCPPPIVIAVVKENTSIFCLLRQRGALLDTPETGAWAMGLSRLHGLDSMRDLLVHEGVSKDALLRRAASEAEAGHSGYLWPRWPGIRKEVDSDEESSDGESWIEYGDEDWYMTNEEMNEYNV